MYMHASAAVGACRSQTVVFLYIKTTQDAKILHFSTKFLKNLRVSDKNGTGQKKKAAQAKPAQPKNM